MATRSLWASLMLRGLIAHYAGLTVASLFVALMIGQNMMAVPEMVGIGALYSAPWLITMLLLFLFVSDWLERNAGLLCLLGPVVVIATAYVSAQFDYILLSWLEPIGIASIVSGISYYALYRRDRKRVRLAAKADVQAPVLNSVWPYDD